MAMTRYSKTCLKNNKLSYKLLFTSGMRSCFLLPIRRWHRAKLSENSASSTKWCINWPLPVNKPKYSQACIYNSKHVTIGPSTSQPSCKVKIVSMKIIRLLISLSSDVDDLNCCLLFVCTNHLHDKKAVSNFCL